MTSILLEEKILSLRNERSNLEDEIFDIDAKIDELEIKLAEIESGETIISEDTDIEDLVYNFICTKQPEILIQIKLYTEEFELEYRLELLLQTAK